MLALLMSRCHPASRCLSLHLALSGSLSLAPIASQHLGLFCAMAGGSCGTDKESRQEAKKAKEGPGSALPGVCSPDWRLSGWAATLWVLQLVEETVQPRLCLLVGFGAWERGACD